MTRSSAPPGKALILRSRIHDGDSQCAGAVGHGTRFDRWKGVKDELVEFPEEFLIDEHVSTMMQCLRWLAHKVAEIERSYLEAHGRRRVRGIA